ncbi:MAG TPA: methyltransferase domain-containing protein [Terriglobales bacterium]|nr:methyltransferase domain-containing protein [Terriglobales bacterium]
MNMRAELWIAIFILALLWLVARSRRRKQPIPWIHILFFCSGFPALIYQITWQRALFGVYGINIESVTIVVSAFMFGLGLGSLIGGRLSKNPKAPLLVLFALAEFGTAAFGLISLRLFHWVAEFTAGAPLAQTALISFALVVIPTILMGATLPLLVEHMVRASRNVGWAVGGLYFVNTLGSAAACFIAGDVLMRVGGLSGSVRVAALINIFIGGSVLICGRTLSIVKSDESVIPQAYSDGKGDDSQLLPFPLALACVAFAGLLALSYEIIWYRILSFATGGIARVFAFLLGSYLAGVALGSRIVEHYCQTRGSGSRMAARRGLGWIMFLSALISFIVGPLFAYSLKFGSVYMLGGQSIEAYSLLLLLIGVGASLFGATFPLVSHVSVRSDGTAGASLSYLYAANIAGSTLGSFAVGFVLMNYFSLWQISSGLLIVGVLFAMIVLATKSSAWRVFQTAAVGLAAVTLAITLSHPVFETIYDRLLFKAVYPRFKLQRVVETRSGAIGETPDGILYGGGVYDGRFSTDPMHDVNLIVRPYAISALHPAARHVLMIGLGSGSWAQALVANPAVEQFTAVEINPAYLQLIPEHPDVSSLLRNPKVKIVIDDGRRWLLCNRDARFDVIVMNTSYFWRDHSTNLLSRDFLEIIREHLNPGGLFLYNTTGSRNVMATGLAAFPYVMRVANALVVSDSPLVFDRERWRAALLTYDIDGKPIIDASDSNQMRALDHLVNIPDDPTGKQIFSIEDNRQLRQRLQNLTVITDDNMATEWLGE